MSLLGLINDYDNMFEDSFIIRSEQESNDYCIILSENDKLSKLRQLRVKNVPQNTIAFSLHEYSKRGVGNKLGGIFKVKKQFKGANHAIPVKNPK